MTLRPDLGGDPPCWSHLLEPPERDLCDPVDIELLVRSFYRRAATDDLLGPVFDAARVDWSAHIPKLVVFWSWQLLGVRGYEGNPLRSHERLQAATPFRDEHYERWLELFDETVDEQFGGPIAETAKGRARKMARALRRLLAGESAAGELPVAVTRLETRPS
ncbi:MAG: group III truncated hemoglobin [Acidimicrobiia bacterium]